jgi:hypothetical protein
MILRLLMWLFPRPCRLLGSYNDDRPEYPSEADDA